MVSSLYIYRLGEDNHLPYVFSLFTHVHLFRKQRILLVLFDLLHVNIINLFHNNDLFFLFGL